MTEEWRQDPTDWKARHAQGLIKPTTHALKTWPAEFMAVKFGTKTFEIRFNDRKFRVGDTLILQEFDPRDDTYTGEVVTKRVTYIQELGDHVCMGLA